jgi:methionyl aminopeptidase
MLRPGRLQIKLKSPREIGLMREAGRVVARAHAEVRKLAVPGATTHEMNEAVVRVFKEVGAEPLFLNYPSHTRGVKPFPGVICASVNEVVVHGIPDRAPLKEGDIVSVDTGCRLGGWCGDSAYTLAIGQVAPEHQKLMDVTRQTLELAIRCLSRAKLWSEVAVLMDQFVRKHGMGVVEKFVGHGIGKDMHEEPQVPNFVSQSLRRNDIRIEPGLVLAIEPMVCMGTKHVKVLPDGWTVVTKDGKYAAHFEHTVAITQEGPRILTLTDEEEAAVLEGAAKGG